MEAPEEAIGSNSSSVDSVDFIHAAAAAVVKGKRTRRPRHGHPPAPPVGGGSSSVAANAASSSTSSADHPVEATGSNITDEEDMANCLILLSQGRRSFDAGGRTLPEEPATAGKDAYECKTCNKSFPSFQALGGHRASHKKLKLAPPPMAGDEKVTMKEVSLQISLNSSPAIPAGGGSSVKPKVHECSRCGAEFNSGQALGGHMRRHRPLVPPEQKKIVGEEKKERSFLSLDLNLPAPADDELRQLPSPEFAFYSKQSLVLFSPPPESASTALVDCHY